MSALLDVILPVFLVLGFGYVAVWRGWFEDAWVEGLMRFTQNYAIPCLLFRNIAAMDLQQDFDLAMLGSFYAGALGGFVAGLAGARWIFGRPWPDAVAIGFVGLFSNSVLLGLPITERAYGPEALTANYSIIALHAPFCYAIGLTAMELARNAGGGLRAAGPRILRAVFRNALVIGIGLGFAVNLTGMPLPGVLTDAVDMMARAALPAALFGLGGTLYRYRPEGDMKTILYIVACSLLLHPAITWTLATWQGVDTAGLRSAVLIATGLTVLTAWFWIAVLP